MPNRLFISYTAEDLSTEAAIVKSTAQSLGWEVVDHKDWAVNGKPSVKECLRKVGACDALIVLSALRYGWVPTRSQGGNDKSSITSLEVAHARSRGVPVLPFLSNPTNKECQVDTRLINFQSELREHIAGFFGSDLERLSAAVKKSLEEFDGLKDDSHITGARKARLIIPLLLVACIMLYWIFSAPIAWGLWFEQPIPDFASWILRPFNAGIATAILAAFIFWAFFSNRGRPQCRYRLFPLNGWGIFSLGCCIFIACALSVFGLFLLSKTDPQFESIISRYIDGHSILNEARLLDENRWRGARVEHDITALRDYILPANKARASLSGDLALSTARADVRKLSYPQTKISDRRIRLLLELSRFQILAIEQSAGEAINHFEKVIQPLIEEMDVIWRAEALYALASWIDYWSFTNTYPSLNRNGAPDYKIEDVLQAFDNAIRLGIGPTNKTSWVTCAIIDTRAAVLLKQCGNDSKGICAKLDQNLTEVADCYAKREDYRGLSRANYNKALRFDATGKTVDAYRIFKDEFEASSNIDAGLRAFALQTIAPVVPKGEGLNLIQIEKALEKTKDARRTREIANCLYLLKKRSQGGDTQTTIDCRVARACYLTDGALARREFCGVADIDIKSTSDKFQLGSRISILNNPVSVSGHVIPRVKAEDVIAECDGDVDSKPSVVIHIQNQSMVTARVYSTVDSVLLVRGRETAYCNDDAPRAGPEDIVAAYNDSSAGIRFKASPGDYEFFVGMYNADAIDFDLRIEAKSLIEDIQQEL